MKTEDITSFRNVPSEHDADPSQTAALEKHADLPQPTPEPPAIPAPRDVEYPGLIRLNVDATDTVRGILKVSQTVPLQGGARRMTLLYPKWMPGYHSPQNPIELLAGLRIEADGEVLDWRRDPVEIYAFHVEPPVGATTLNLTFQFLSPTTSTQGDVIVTREMLTLQWGKMLLYPAGYFSRRMTVEPSADLPDGWSFATVLEVAAETGGTITFKPTPLDVLVDSPLMAGRQSKEVALDEGGSVTMSLFAHDPAHLAVTEDQVQLHRELVVQADRLFGARHFDRYRLLTALTEELGGGGVEHHRSAEIIAPPTYFTAWEPHLTKRDVMAHEFVHSWNGKFRRGADSWTPSFERPIRNSLMWVYEGQTQYWGHVLTARSGLWTTAQALEALAKVAATYDVRAGGVWRTLADTTRDPIIAGRAPLPWPSWQRSEDYYSEGQLLWFDVDTLIRELTGDSRSLDDFARAFFGIDPGSMVTRTYHFDDVVQSLNTIAEHDWAALLNDHLESRRAGAPLGGLKRGGYKLAYRDHRSDFCKSYDAAIGQFDLRFSIGMNIGNEGTIQEVMWGGPAFQAGLTAGSTVKRVNGCDYDEHAICDAVAQAADGYPIVLDVLSRSREQTFSVEYRGGHRFPHLEPIHDHPRRLDAIFAPRLTGG